MDKIIEHKTATLFTVPIYHPFPSSKLLSIVSLLSGNHLINKYTENTDSFCKREAIHEKPTVLDGIIDALCM